MKKLLLGTTALIAAGMLAGTASAASPVEVGVGGYYRAAFGFVSDDDSATDSGYDKRSHDIKQDVELQFTGETTLDNGMTVGVHVEMAGQDEKNDNDRFVSNDSSVDETWMYMQGTFGEIRVGDEDDARRLTGVTAPVASSIFGVNDPSLSFANLPTGMEDHFYGKNNTLYEVDNDATKLIYFTPSFNGFTAAVSYAPEDADSASVDRRDGAGMLGALPGEKNSGEMEQLLSIGARYEGELNGVGLTLGAGYTDTSEEVSSTTTDDMTAWHVGGVVSYQEWAFGASYGKASNVDTDKDEDVKVWDAGVTYETGPYQVGLAYSTGEYENASPTAGKDPELDVWALTGTYDLGPGVELTGAVTYTDFDNDTATKTATDNDYEATSFMVGTVVRF